MRFWGLMRSATRLKIGKDPVYLKWLHTLPCVVCVALSGQDCEHRTTHIWQNTPTEAAHIGIRGLSQKCPDREAIPLCSTVHHREGPESAHKLGKAFWSHHGLDPKKLIADLNERFEAEEGRKS